MIFFGNEKLYKDVENYLSKLSSEKSLLVCLFIFIANALFFIFGKFEIEQVIMTGSELVFVYKSFVVTRILIHISISSDFSSKQNIY